MKKDEIPQQNNLSYAGETKALYALNEEGKLETAETSGWDAEEIVLQQAIDDINRQAQEALALARAGEASPLEYHMFAQRMDLPMLAKAMGLFKWQVRRHFLPQHFERLSASRFALYASVLGLTEEELKRIPNE